MLDEHTPYDADLPRGAVVVYVFSQDTVASSQLLSWFAHVHDHLSPRNEYLLALAGVQVEKDAFDFIRHLPVITPKELGVSKDPTEP